MFNKDFYPTPLRIIEEMCGDLSLDGKIVLEPSAGKCDIVDYLKQHNAKVYACELDHNLSFITQNRCDKFLDHDFFNVTKLDVSAVDYIVMNPPFSADEHHVLHAWEIAAEGVEIRALCNTNTIVDASTKYQLKLLKIIEENGVFVHLGKVFTDSERKTSVNVSLISLKKPGQRRNDEFFDYFTDEEDHEVQYDGIMPFNEVRQIVNSYVGSVRMFDDVMSKANEINSLSSIFSKFNTISFGAFEKSSRNNQFTSITREVYKTELQKSAWNYVFARLNMEKYLTSKMKAKINDFCETQHDKPFTMKNVYKMVDVVTATYKQNMIEAMLDVFDTITAHYYDNRYMLDGWKTNQHNIVNKTIILPNIVSTDKYYMDRVHIEYRSTNTQLMVDLTKSLCFLTGEDFNSVVDIETWARGVSRSMNWYLNNESLKESILKEYDDLSTRENRFVTTKTPPTKEEWVLKRLRWMHDNGKHSEYRDFGVWYDWGFFEVKGFKKGTMHFRFKDLAVWELLNREVAKHKGMVLPEKL